MIARKLLTLLHTETGGLHAAAYLLAGFTFLSQILGLVRDRLLAHTFGADTLLDVYYAAFRIPDLVLIFAGSIVSIAILVPLLTKHLNHTKEEGKRFVDSVFTFFFLFIVLVSAILFFILPYILDNFFPGLVEKGVYGELVKLSRLFLLSPLFLGLSNLFASIVQVKRRFLVYALSPVLYNAGIILGIIWLYPMFGLFGVGVGVVLGALFHLLIQVPVVSRENLLPSFVRSVDWPEIRAVVFTSLPRAFTLSIGNIVIVFLLGFASLFREGSISIFNFGINLQSVPLSIVGVSYSLAAFPLLSELFEKNKIDEFRGRVQTALHHIVFWSLPALVMFIVLRAQIVRTVLGSGAFDWTDTRLTAAVLALFVVSVIAQAISLLVIRAYYATGNTKKPLVVGVVSGLLMVVLTFVFYDMYQAGSVSFWFLEALLHVEYLPGTEVLILPLAYSVGMFVNMIGLLWWFQKDFNVLSGKTVRTFFHTFSASIIGGFTAFRFLYVFDDYFNLDTVSGVFFQGLSAGVIGILLGLGILLVLGNKEVEEVYRSIRSKISKDQNILLPDTDEL